MKLNASLRNYLKNGRKTAKLTQKRLGERLDSASFQMISNIENGHQEISEPILAGWIRECGLDRNEVVRLALLPPEQDDPLVMEWVDALLNKDMTTIRRIVAEYVLAA